MPTEVDTQTGNNESQAQSQPQAEPQGSAADLTPAQVEAGTGRAATVDIPKGADKPADQPKPDGGDRGNQPVPTNGEQAHSGATQTAEATLDAAAMFAQVKKLPAGELDRLIEAIDSELKEADDDDGEVDLDEPSTSTGKRASADDEPIGYSRLDVGSQKAIGAVHSHMVEQAIGQALDSDQELSYNMKQASPKAQESVKSIIRDRLQRLVDERGDRFDYNWGHAAQQAVAAEKTRLAPFFERPARPGMGPGSQTDHQMNRELKEPERVPGFADERDQDEYLMEKMRHTQALIEREQSNVPGA
ncbi:MAG: hypothetical protein ACYTAO_15940 [Planctomycetota bacterium]|jgi:hypothetical protein